MRQALSLILVLSVARGLAAAPAEIEDIVAEPADVRPAATEAVPALEPSSPPPAPEPRQALPVAQGRNDAGAFYKGELGSPGAPELENPNDAIFLGVGYYNLGGLLGQHYMRLKPSIDLYFDTAEQKQLVVRLQAPINVLMYDRSDPERRGEIRRQDWDEVGDFLRVFKQVRYGRKEDKLYVNAGLTHGVSLGHGTVMRRYDANIDGDRARLGLAVDAYNDYGGFESFAADLGWQTRILGALVFVKPLSLVTENATARSWSLGLHYTTDLAAPERLTRTNGVVDVDDAGYPRFTTTQVGILGFDMELKPVRLGDWLDLKLYADYSRLDGGGGGFSAGTLLRSSFGPKGFVNAARVRLEGRYYDGNYEPQYFDSLYEVQKLQMFRGPITGNDPTKYEAVTQGAAGEKRTSIYAEASYAIVDRLVVGAGLERVLDPATYDVLLHLEVPAFEFLRLYASYQKVGITSLGDALPTWNGEGFEPNVVLATEARLMLLPILFVSAGLRQLYQWEEAYNDGSYRPRLDWLLEAELGWEFD